MKVETKVGLLFIAAIALAVLFAYYLGVLNPFSNSHELNVTYNFAGGIEVGSPVRVMGLKVGKVQEIIFDPNMKDNNGKEVKLKLRISIDKKAWDSIREDSRFYINLAGVIGEKLMEISPGSTDHSILQPGAIVRGEDPPRIDQLISQSYGLAGKLLEFVEKNEGSVTNAIEKADKLISNVNSLASNINKTLAIIDKMGDRQDVSKLLKNTIRITDNLVVITDGMTTNDAKKTYELLYKLVWRLDSLDGPQIKKFLQEEGIKAKMF